MVDRVGKSGGLAHEAVLAAIRSQAERAAELRAESGLDSLAKTDSGDSVERGFAARLEQGIEAVDSSIKRADALPEDLLTGKVEDFHEIAVQLKEAEFGFRFAMEIRNKLIDAYREVMRMSV